MKNILKKAAAWAVAGVMTLSVEAQEEKGIRFNVSGDFVSSYVWRGVDQNANACVQPTLGLSIGGFSLTAWGSTTLADIDNGHKELDFTAAYSFHNFTIQLADLWWMGQSDTKYFHWKARTTGHHLELGLAYALPCKEFPLSVAWYTVLYGDDRREATADRPYGKQNYSSYAELNYPFTVKGVSLNATLGFVPYESRTFGLRYNVGGFAITNLALKATKEIRFSDHFSLPLYAQVIFNPAHEKAHLVLGFTLR